MYETLFIILFQIKKISVSTMVEYVKLHAKCSRRTMNLIQMKQPIRKKENKIPPPQKKRNDSNFANGVLFKLLKDILQNRKRMIKKYILHIFIFFRIIVLGSLRNVTQLSERESTNFLNKTVPLFNLFFEHCAHLKKLITPDINRSPCQ